MSRWFRVTVPATTANLGPGFDTLGMALELRNVVELTLTKDGVSIEIQGEGSDQLLRDRTNLVVQAMGLVAEAAGQPLPGVSLRMQNAIPLARGLGSSAAATVAGVVLAGAALGLRLSPEEMLRLAVRLEGHPDNVAPCLLGGLTVAIPGDVPRALRLDPPDLMVALLIPNFGLSTSDARAVLPETVSRQDAVFNVSRAALWVAALVTRRYELLSAACEDRLHQPYRRQLIPYLDDVVAAALGAGAAAAFLSGAGPSVAALVRSEAADTVVRAMQTAALAYGVEARSVLTEPSPRGVTVESGDG
jgi:homoserine kinase